jgi:hypothetical protein
MTRRLQMLEAWELNVEEMDEREALESPLV